MFEHVPLFKHGPDAQGLVSLWQETPVLNWLHWHTYLFWESSKHMPWLEQLAKHDDISPVYPCKTLLLNKMFKGVVVVVVVLDSVVKVSVVLLVVVLVSVVEDVPVVEVIVVVHDSEVDDAEKN